MKKLILSITITFLFAALAQGQHPPFAMTFGGTEEDNLSSIKVTSTGRAITGGRTHGFDAPQGRDMLVSILNTDGSLSNSWTIGTDTRDGINSIVPLSEHSFIITGATVKNNTGATTDDWVILKMGTAGHITMEKFLGNPDHDDQLHGAILTSDKRIVACGVTGIPGGNRIGTVAMLDTLGGILWAKAFDEGPSIEVFEKIKETTDGLLIVGSSNALDGSGQDVSLAKLDFSGNLLWSKVYDDGNISRGDKFIEVLENGEAIIVDNLVNGDDLDILLIKVNATGGVIWARKYGGPKSESCNFIIQGNDGNLLAGGSTNSFGQDGSNALLFKIDPAGNLLWAHAYGEDGNESFYSIDRFAAENSQRYLLAGLSSSFTQDGNTDAFVVRVNENGQGFLQCFTSDISLESEDRTSQITVNNIGALSNWSEPASHDFTVTERSLESLMLCPPVNTYEAHSHSSLRLFPNPAGGQALVRWELPLPQNGSLQLFNAQGRLMLRREIEQGTSEVALDTSQLPDGLYFLEVQIGKKIDAGKLMVRR